MIVQDGVTLPLPLPLPSTLADRFKGPDGLSRCALGGDGSPMPEPFNTGQRG